MADISIKNQDSTKVRDRKNQKPQSTLIVEMQHLMKGVDPFLCGCRHLIKDAMPSVHKHDRVILEHPGPDGSMLYRVIKDRGFSCQPYYIDRSTGKVVEPATQ